MKDKINYYRDKFGCETFHGYQEWYNFNGEIYFRGSSKHNFAIRYNEYHDMKITRYFIK